MKTLFEIPGIQTFWEKTHTILPPHDNRIFSWAGMRGVQPTGEKSIYLPDLLYEVLEYYDNEPLSPSMAGPNPKIIPIEIAWNKKMRLLATPLWRHVINAGDEYLRHAEQIIRNNENWTASGCWSIVIVIIAHDLGKLRRLRPVFPDKYKTELHPKYGADEFSKIIGNRLPELNKQKFIDAVLKHHYAPCLDDYSNQRGNMFLNAVIAADRLAREAEDNDLRANRSFKRALTEMLI